MFFYLSHNPVAYAILVAEIRSTFKSADQIHADAGLSSCHYLRACIDETLRMSPPSLAILWRQQEADYHEPFIVDGQIIPPNTQVGVSLTLARVFWFFNFDLAPDEAGDASSRVKNGAKTMGEAAQMNSS
ncbi:cytochrome P450 [Nemania diffusa]|nr:cytochrome P450 [Nemania diffusa]